MVRIFLPVLAFWSYMHPIAHRLLQGTAGPGGPSLNCSVDGGTPVNVNASTTSDQPGFHTELYSATNLTAGPHTLNLSLTNSASLTDWCLDYFIYTPSTPVSSESIKGARSFFDDVDPAFQYSGPWSTGDGTPEDMQGTLHGALALNSSVSLKFTGTTSHGHWQIYICNFWTTLGTFVDVFVRLPDSTNLTSVAQVVIDTDPPFTVNYPPTEPVSDAVTNAASNYNLFHGSFAPGSHQLVITAMAEQALWLDYVTVGIDSDPPNSTSGGGSSTSSSSVTSSATGTPGSSSSSPSTNNAILYGGLLGTVASLALIALVIFLCLRWKRKKRQDSEKNGEGTVTPFNPIPENGSVIPAPYTIHIQDLGAPSDNLPSNGNAPLVRKGLREKAGILRSETPIGASSEAASTSSPAQDTSGIRASTTSPPSVGHPKRHEDSGLRGLEPPASEEVPPSYSME